MDTAQKEGFIEAIAACSTPEEVEQIGCWECGNNLEVVGYPDETYHEDGTLTVVEHFRCHYCNVEVDWTRTFAPVGLCEVDVID